MKGPKVLSSSSPRVIATRVTQQDTKSCQVQLISPLVIHMAHIKIAAYYASELGIGGGHYAVLVFLNGNADHMIALANVVQHVKAFCNATKDGMDSI